MFSSHLRARTARMTVLVASLLVALTCLTAPAAPAGAYASVVDDYAPYEPQSGCVTAPLPGTADLMTYLEQTWPGLGGMGSVRSCGTGGLSEHKDGRAVDWMVDARVKQEKRAAMAFIRQLLASDADGTPHALARRAGVMYVIYRDRLWSSYRGFKPVPYVHSACKSKRKCSATLRHVDHVHVSLSRAGGAGQTSFYRDRGVTAIPVLLPGTDELDYAGTALTPLDVPGDGSVARTGFKLAAGTTYRVVAVGTATSSGGVVADAACSTGSGAWTPSVPGLPTPVPTPVPTLTPVPTTVPLPARASRGSVQLPSVARVPDAVTVGVLVNGKVLFDPVCSPEHTYQAWVRVNKARRLRVQLAGGATEGVSSLRLWVARDDVDVAELAR